MRARFCLLLLPATAIAACPAFGGSFAIFQLGSTCPQGSAFADGCGGAPVSGNFQQSNFFTYSRQSGQSAYSIRPPWNVAGVDYAIGYPSATVLQTPPTGLPTGCTLASTLITCTMQNCAGGNCTLDSMNLDGYAVAVTGTGGNGTFTLSNSLVKVETNAGSNSGIINVQVNTTPVNVVIKNVYFDGNVRNFPTSAYQYFVFLADSTLADTLNVSYTAVYNTAGTPFHSVGTGNIVIQYSYADLTPYSGSGYHVEFLAYQPGGSISLEQQSFNTVLYDATASLYGTGSACTSCGSANAMVFSEISTTMSTVQVDHNTLVSNKSGGSNMVAFLGNLDAQPSTTGGTVSQMTWSTNYFDPTGALDCLSLTGTVTRTSETISGNIDMLDGSAANSYGGLCFGHN